MLGCVVLERLRKPRRRQRCDADRNGEECGRDADERRSYLARLGGRGDDPAEPVVHGAEPLGVGDVERRASRRLGEAREGRPVGGHRDDDLAAVSVDGDRPGQRPESDRVDRDAGFLGEAGALVRAQGAMRLGAVREEDDRSGRLCARGRRGRLALPGRRAREVDAATQRITDRRSVPRGKRRDPRLEERGSSSAA